MRPAYILLFLESVVRAQQIADEPLPVDHSLSQSQDDELSYIEDVSLYLYPPQVTNCSEKVYKIIQLDQLSDNKIAVRYWHPKFSCFVTNNFEFHHDDTVQSFANSIKNKLSSSTDSTAAHLLLDGTRLHDTKLIRHFLNNIWNGGILTLELEMKQKYAIDVLTPYGDDFD